MRSIKGKLFLFVSTILAALVFAVCIFGALHMLNYGYYNCASEEEVYENYAKSLTYDLLYEDLWVYEDLFIGKALSELADSGLYTKYELEALTGFTVYGANEMWNIDAADSNLRYSVYDSDGNEVLRSGIDDESVSGLSGQAATYLFYVSYAVNMDADGSVYSETILSDHDDFIPSYRISSSSSAAAVLSDYTINAYIDESYPVADNYAIMAKTVAFTYLFRYAVYPIGVLALVLAIVSFVALMRVSARRPNSEAICPGALHRVPIEALLVGALLLEAASIDFIDRFVYGDTSYYIALLLIFLITACLFLGLCMSVAARIKENTLLTSSLLFRARGWLLRGCKQVFHTLGFFFLHLPLIWKTVLVTTAVCLLELLLLCSFIYYDLSGSAYLLLWLFEKLLVVPLIFYIAFMQKRLYEAGCALAAGQSAHKVDVHGLFWDFKLHGDHLNHIADGIAVSVEQAMKSERMKTELITNVSHDIKTPLTSIVNYADLIEKEPCDNAKITEYAAVLSRQSERLKRLIEDLVEASKASTGNLDVVLTPCDAGVFLTQAAGEYEEKLTKAGLTLIVSAPDAPVRILADGRRMLRVFDNLLNNVCKYAQTGTRVYLSLTLAGSMAEIVFKNVSHTALNVSADELIERFVRGDAARTTEGSGLGLSIAKSLTELQKGTLQLDIDGDLFKVTLRFPILDEQKKEL